MPPSEYSLECPLVFCYLFVRGSLLEETRLCSVQAIVPTESYKHMYRTLIQHPTYNNVHSPSRRLPSGGANLAHDVCPYHMMIPDRFNPFLDSFVSGPFTVEVVCDGSDRILTYCPEAVHRRRRRRRLCPRGGSSRCISAGIRPST